MFFCYFVISQQLIANFAMLLGNMLPQVKNNTNIYNFRLSQIYTAGPLRKHAFYSSFKRSGL